MDQQMSERNVWMNESMYDVRQATLSDLEDIVALDQRCHESAWSKVHFVRALGSPEHEVWGVWEDGALIGVLVLGLQPFDAEIELIVVAPERRRRGVASMLVMRGVDSGRALGKERLLLEVRAGNAAAIGVYVKRGFIQDGVRPGYYPADGAEREDGVLMSYPLCDLDTTSSA
ncbi:GNAT family N-acetyltransferase [Larsenimonas suaedae]|uniref:GNAT family N-acetyltransferase n=1 Tax=Larsenimonas suaedae TaxID=1851019 RepID=A0ABU1GWW9_9GAMM|nr:GNAT family N-acetyltransferase [Larsenimonas suaedae]MCM2973114.1 GNAT family N-acetyltransferase [Larsenimonas suaedae]MDR5896551.1 GNAT family N-acetyltransferase [Larsenimonas suaedae]